MLGEYAQDMQDAPYALEGLIEDWEDETSPEVYNILVYNPWEPLLKN